MTECFTWGVRSMLFKLLICMFVGISALNHEYETCVFFQGSCAVYGHLCCCCFFFTFNSVVCAPNTHSPPHPPPLPTPNIKCIHRLMKYKRQFCCLWCLIYITFAPVCFGKSYCHLSTCTTVLLLLLQINLLTTACVASSL